MENKGLSRTADARRRFQTGILAAFDEIAQTYLDAMRGKRVTAEAFCSLQKYLDGTVVINGARHRRRGILLAVHDMKDNREASVTLQKKAKARLMLLEMQPVPELRHYRDVATAILRVEAVIRQSANQAPRAEERQPHPAIHAVAQLLDYRQQLQASLASAVSACKSTPALGHAYLTRLNLQLSKLAATLAANIRLLAWRAPVARQTMGLPST
jgi:hypothetical protein